MKNKLKITINAKLASLLFRLKILLKNKTPFLQSYINAMMKFKDFFQLCP